MSSVIYEDRTAHDFIKHVDIELDTIRKVTLSPWLPDKVAKSFKALINTIKGCESIPVNRSSLVNNSRWKKAIE